MFSRPRRKQPDIHQPAVMMIITTHLGIPEERTQSSDHTSNVTEWNLFWTTFVGAIDSDPDMSKVNKLTYLQGCIKDPEVNPILFNGVNNEVHYDDVVRQLKDMYDKPRMIHAAYCNKMVESTPIKSTQADLRGLVNDVKHVILGLKSLEQYDIESCYASLTDQHLPKPIRVLWQTEHKTTRHVVPISKLLIFLEERAAAGAAMAIPSLTNTLSTEHIIKQEKKPDKPKQSVDRNSRHKAAVHVAAPSPAFKYDRLLCKPEKHVLYHCPKFNDMDIKARREYVKNNKLFFNCLIPGHKNTECRNPGTCRPCAVKHNTLVHQADQRTDSRASTNSATSSKPTDILMMTSKVLLEGPGGRTCVARALPQLMLPILKAGAGNSPMAWHTIFGWAIFGPFQSSANTRDGTSSSMNYHVHLTSTSDQLLQQFWEVEEVSAVSKAFTPEEEAVQSHFSSTHSYLSSQCRYQVALPRKIGAPELGESKTQALQRFRSNEASTLREHGRHFRRSSRSTWTLTTPTQ